jgi:glutamate N-acetyltransferase/amino-acid N-acetyltransferase
VKRTQRPSKHAGRRPPAGVTAPSGFFAASARAGLREGRERDDLALVVSSVPATAAGVFTANRVKAAPVLWSQARVRAGRAMRAVLLNSGNANACTGAAGARVVRRSAAAAARVLGCSPEEVLVASTGVIGVPLPVERLVAALPRLAAGLGHAAAHARRAARAIMTTDTRPKQAVAALRGAGRTYTVGGMAKGSGMIHPQMATMLAVLTTDAPLAAAQARRLLSGAVERTFNAVTVDGDTSTNDCVLLLANGAAGGRVAVGGAAERALGAALERVCAELAEAVARDGEGARKLLVVRVSGARSEREARDVARTVASSPLVKAAVHGGDPNWGRVFAAAGRAGVALDPDRMNLYVGGHCVARAGAAHPRGERPAARHLRGRRVELDLHLGAGRARGTALGCDLSADYVSINSHYRS